MAAYGAFSRGIISKVKAQAEKTQFSMNLQP